MGGLALAVIVYFLFVAFLVDAFVRLLILVLGVMVFVLLWFEVAFELFFC
jgi:hypothetical protein